MCETYCTACDLNIEICVVTIWMCIAELFIVCVKCFSRSRKLPIEFLHLSESKMFIAIPDLPEECNVSYFV